VPVADQNYAEFKTLLETALAIDPDSAPSFRLANLVSRERAKILLQQAEDLFLVTDDEEEP
jgi:predicted anti-sigma-YlaC factor YlaD